MGGRSFVANGARGAGSGMLSTIDEAGARSRSWVPFWDALGAASGGFALSRFDVSACELSIAPRVNRGARGGVMVCDGSMNAQTLERPVLDEPQLTAANRCDACGARAWVRATMPSGGQLYFCGHHANEHLPSLVGAGAQILDERHFMND